MLPSETAAAPENPELAKEGWVPIKHSSGAAVQDVQAGTPGFDDPITTGSGKASDHRRRRLRPAAPTELRSGNAPRPIYRTRQ